MKTVRSIEKDGIQILSNLNSIPEESFIENKPELDFRDPNTVWIWLSSTVCVELTKELIDEIQIGFKENFEEIEV